MTDWRCWTPEYVRIIAAAWSTIKLHDTREAKATVEDMMSNCGVPGTPCDVLDIWGLALKFRGYTAKELVVSLESGDKLRVTTVSGRGPEVEIDWPMDGSPTPAEIAENIEAAWRARRLREETQG